MKKTLKIFVKNPERGKVKTRISASVGDDYALSIYKELLHYTKKVVLKINAQKEIWYSHFVDENDLWEKSFFTKEVQLGKDLGLRMKQAFQQTFLKDEHAQIVLIGSDCAELEEGHINEAFELLKKTDVVIGPAEDGGYYLIGMSKFIPEIFDEITWSSSKVLDQTISKVNEQGIRFNLLETLSDVDEYGDWERVKSKVLSHD